ncbi:MAG: PspC domain-containing protein [Bacteroidota bacterium]|nr:PspC domain-containing protein [Bacteroidota bacterium]
MNKTIISNISGMIFHLNEDAYEKLNTYLQTISSYFSDSQGKAEIMADIEARIAEMFKAKITDTNQVITKADVDGVIAIMGQPEEYLDGQEPPVAPAFDKNKHRRVFRDPDDRILGGVCAGLSAYFGIKDPIWLRLFFVLMFFFFGTGPLIYIILWIVIPVAKTPSEKLEMKGEPVNVNNISKSVNEEFEGLKKKFNEFSNEAKNLNKSANYNSIRLAINRFVDLVLNLIRLILISISKLFGVLLIFLSLVLLIVIVTFFAGSNLFISSGIDGASAFSFNEVFSYLFYSTDQINLAKIGLFLVLFIPFVSILIAGIKILFGIKKKLVGMGSVLLLFWLSGIAVLIFITYDLSKEFSNKASSVQVISPLQPDNSTIYIGMNKKEKPNFIVGSKGNRHIFNIQEDNLLVGYPKLNIIKSETDSFTVTITTSSFGSSRKEALERSKNIGYNYMQTDSLIDFDDYFRISNNDKYRFQQVYITVKVPEGKSVELSPLLKKMLHNVENINSVDDRNMAGKKWKMTSEGLTCENC